MCPRPVRSDGGAALERCVREVSSMKQPTRSTRDRDLLRRPTAQIQRRLMAGKAPTPWAEMLQMDGKERDK